MIARWDSKCSLCSKPVKAGEDVHYDSEAKQVSHWPCRENPVPTPADFALAQRLHFMSHDAALHQKWSEMRFLYRGDRSDVTRGAGPARGEQSTLWSMPASTEE